MRKGNAIKIFAHANLVLFSMWLLYLLGPNLLSLIILILLWIIWMVSQILRVSNIFIKYFCGFF